MVGLLEKGVNDLVNKAYPGTKSSVILSIVVVGILLLPCYMANNRERLRSGEGGYEFNEVICFDINDVSQFDNTYVFDGYPYQGVYGQGSFCWRWFGGGQSIHFTNTPVTMVYDSLDGTVDGYGTAITQTYQGESVAEPSNQIFYALTMTWGEFLDYDVTSIEIFIDGVPTSSVDVGLLKMSPPPMEVAPDYFFYEEIVLGEKSRIDVSVEDLLEIVGSENEQIILLITTQYVLIPGLEIIFDMQWFNIEEIKVSTVDFMGIAMAGGGVFMIFCSILMLPTIEFSGVISRITGKGS